MYKKPTISIFINASNKVPPVCEGCCESLIPEVGTCAINAIFPIPQN